DSMRWRTRIRRSTSRFHKKISPNESAFIVPKSFLLCMGCRILKNNDWAQEAVTKGTALGKHVSCFQLGRRFSHRLMWEKQPGDWAAVKLRPESEMDTFSCSHRCTLTVRLWLGARWCYRTGASRSVSCASYFLLLTSYFLLLTSYFLLLTSY